MRIENKIKINIIRHGKTELNEKHCYIGITNAPLSQNGKDEIIAKNKLRIYPSCELLFVSPMRRVKETASIIYPDKEQIEIEEFREMDFGSFEGKNYNELKDNNYYRKWIDESRGISVDELKSKYGEISCETDDVILPEKMSDFTERVLSGIKKVIKSSNNIKEVSIVAHGGTIMALSSMVDNSDFYKYMVSCGEGIETELAYTYKEDGSIEISRFSIHNRIHS